MNRTLAASALLLASLLGITACAAETPDAGSADEPKVAAETSTPADPVDDESTDSETLDTSMPQGARAGSVTFPFPVPEDWPELEPFAEEKIGKDVGLYASFGFPGDAASASATYQSLLKVAGFQIHPNPLGEQVHDASFVVEGRVDGSAYSGTLDFDTIADGTQRVAINLTED